METNLNLQENIIVGKKQKLAVTRNYTIMGLALLAMVLLTVCLQNMMFGVASGYMEMKGKTVEDITWLKWAISFVPIYLIAMPVAVAIMKNIPIEKGNKVRLGIKNFILLLLMAEGIMAVGNTVGNMLPYIITRGNSVNSLLNYAMDESLYKIIIMCVLAPFFEEYIFRKQIIDRCSKYGEGEAIFFSALTFALFHMNLYQFFYAFGLGLMFAYVYTRTRNLKYNVAMHMIINFIGAVIAPWIISKVDMDVIYQIATGQIDESVLEKSLGGIILYFSYLMIYLGLSITGIVLLVVKRKQFIIMKTSEQLDVKERVKAVYLNLGFILFAVCCLVVAVMNLL